MSITVKQAAKRLGVSVSLIYALVAAGRLRHYRVGLGRGTIRIDEEALAEVKQEPAATGDARLTAELMHLTMS